MLLQYVITIYTMNTCNILLLTAGITGAYDILVRYLSLYRVLNYDWLIALRSLFQATYLA